MTMRESPRGMEASIGCAAGDGMGGGIFAKTAKTPPLQSALRSASRPKAAHCRRHARTMPPRMPPHEPVVLKRRGTPHWLGRALASGRATFGPPLQHLPYQERNSQSRQLIENAIHVNDAARRVVFRLHAVSRWLNAHTLPPRMPPTYGDLRSLSRRGTIYRAAARPVATNAPHPDAHARPTATVAVNGIATGAWCARMVGTGGGIFAYGE